MDRADEASPLQMIKDALPGLNGATLRVAKAILDDPEAVGRGSITKLADGASTSAATVTRLSTSLGYAGFPALRAAIAKENGRDVQAGWEQDIGTMIAPDDSPDQVLNVLASTHAQALRNALGAVDLAVASRLADAIAQAGRTHIFGEWGDAIPAEELYIRLLRIGRPVWFHRGVQEARVAASLLGPGDVALAIARSGEEQVAVDFLGQARNRGALTAVVTGMPDSPAGLAAELVLATGTRNGPAWTDYFAGRASDALTAGLLWVLVAQRTSDSMAAAFDHTHQHDSLSRKPTQEE